jgi:hypothetical protein
MNQELIRAIQARRRQLADQIEAEQKRGDHNRAYAELPGVGSVKALPPEC